MTLGAISRTAFQILLPVVLASLSASGFAAQQARMQDVIGLGALAAAGNHADSYSFFVEGHHHFKQTRTIWGIRQYGFSQSRLELGNGVGVTVDALSGITLLGLKKGDHVAAHLGIEPFNAQLTWNSQSSRASYYEWYPMASLGVQALAGSCRVLPLVRLGGSVGNLGRHGISPAIHPAAGLEANLNCRNTDFAAYLTRVDPLGARADVAALDIALPLSSSGWTFGFRGELLSFHPESAQRERESRMMFVVRSSLFSN